MIKRIFDLLGAMSLLVLCAPAMAAIALAIRLRMGPPVLLRQVRPGWHGKPFAFMKFRTMTYARDEAGSLLPDRMRLTPLGETLRKWSVDELPQLFNVMKGDMSLVGPRPLLMEYLPLYNPEQARRHEVRPGISGWAQVNGRNAISWEERFRLDVWYVDHRSFLLDLRILALTLKRVLLKEGISAADSPTMHRFAGNGSGAKKNG